MVTYFVQVLSNVTRVCNKTDNYSFGACYISNYYDVQQLMLDDLKMLECQQSSPPWRVLDVLTTFYLILAPKWFIYLFIYFNKKGVCDIVLLSDVSKAFYN